MLWLIVSWHIARPMRLGRTCPTYPDFSATLLFEPDEITAAYALTRKPVPTKTPTLNEIVRPAATIGGFLARKGDGEPGVKTLWLGVQQIYGFTEGVRHLRQAAGVGGCVMACD